MLDFLFALSIDEKLCNDFQKVMAAIWLIFCDSLAFKYKDICLHLFKD